MEGVSWTPMFRLLAHPSVEKRAHTCAQGCFTTNKYPGIRLVSVKLRLSAAVHREGKRFVSWCPELGVASQGRTVEEALSNLREALELRLEGQDVDLPQEPFLLTTVEVEHGQAPRPGRP